MVAFLPEDERENLIKQANFVKYNERTIHNKNEYRSILAKVRKCGYATDNAEEIEGMHCVSAPIFNRHGYPVAAIWITGPSYRIKHKDFEKIGIELKKATYRISKSLGYVNPKSKIQNPK
jgi:DNA-binding IclR family transcriptional regulator